MRSLRVTALAAMLVLAGPVPPDEAVAQVSGAVPGVPDPGPIPTFELAPSDGTKVVALTGRIKNNVLDVSSVEVRPGFAPEDFGGAERMTIDLLGPDGRTVQVQSFMDPRRYEELDGGRAGSRAETPFEVTIPYRSGTTDLRVNLPSGVTPAADQRLFNGVNMVRHLGPAPSMRIDLRGAFTEYCRSAATDRDCQVVLNRR
ncbi:MAG TPA: hypothetical protein VF662_01945 [Allosphingosinicella sp.]|jgi:hypothetical protein